MKSESLYLSSGLIVLFRNPGGTLGTRTVSWADVDAAGSDAMSRAVELAAETLADDAEIVGVSMGDGYKMRSVETVAKYRVGDFVVYPL